MAARRQKDSGGKAQQRGCDVVGVDGVLCLGACTLHLCDLSRVGVLESEWGHTTPHLGMVAFTNLRHNFVSNISSNVTGNGIYQTKAETKASNFPHFHEAQRAHAA